MFKFKIKLDNIKLDFNRLFEQLHEYGFFKLIGKLIMFPFNILGRLLKKIKIRHIIFLLVLVGVGVFGVNRAKVIYNQVTQIEIDPSQFSTIEYSGIDGQGVMSLQPDTSNLENYSEKEQQRISNTIETVAYSSDSEEGLSNGDQITIELSIPDVVLETNRVKLTTNQLTGTVESLEDEEEVFERDYAQKEQIAETALADYIEKSTTPNSHYADPIFLGVRESATCGYTLFDYSSTVESDKQYISVFIYDDSQEEESNEPEVKEYNSLYTNNYCEITGVDSGRSLLDFTTPEIDKDVYKQLQGFAQSAVDDNLSASVDQYTSFSDATLETELIYNSQQFVFVYNAKRYWRDNEENMYLFVYFDNIYVEDDQVVDYYIPTISVRNDEGLSYSEAYGLEFRADDKIDKTISFT